MIIVQRNIFTGSVKHYLTLLLALTCFNAFADTISLVADIASSEFSSCEAEYHGVPISPDAKYCQSFDGKQPVSFVYFSPKPVTDMVDFYLSTNHNYHQTTTVQSRIILSSSEENHRLIVSQDNKGSQIDILVFTKE